jgi:hypothetical protein
LHIRELFSFVTLIFYCLYQLFQNISSIATSICKVRLFYLLHSKTFVNRQVNVIHMNKAVCTIYCPRIYWPLIRKILFRLMLFLCEDLLSVDYLKKIILISVFLMWVFTVHWLPWTREMNKWVIISSINAFSEQKNHINFSNEKSFIDEWIIN